MFTGIKDDLGASHNTVYAIWTTRRSEIKFQTEEKQMLKRFLNDENGQGMVNTV
jgi:hypothetical protein